MSGNLVFELKRIRFPVTLCSDSFVPGPVPPWQKKPSSHVPVVLQNENGPCPLLAIANVLLLRRCISIHPDIARISHNDLVQRIAEYLSEDVMQHLLQSSSSLEGGAEAVAANVHEAIDMLPRMDQGLDLNVRFRHIRDLEATKEISVFDVLGIDLVHGWVLGSKIDGKQESEGYYSDMAAALGSLSYNQVVDVLIGSASSEPPLGNSVSAASQGNATPTKEPERSPRISGDNNNSTNDDDSRDDGENFADMPSSEMAAPVAAAADDGYSPPATTSQALSVPQEVDLKSHENVDARNHADGTMDKAEEKASTRVRLLQHWLESTPEQLTPEGLDHLRTDIRPGQLAVLFRGLHFAVIFRHDDESTGRPCVYTLVTDCGYRNFKNVVWERLDGVGNDTQLCDANFQSAKEEPTVARAGGDGAGRAADERNLVVSAPARLDHNAVEENLLGMSQAQLAEQVEIEEQIRLAASQEQETRDRQLALDLQAQLDRQGQHREGQGQEQQELRQAVRAGPPQPELTAVGESHKNIENGGKRPSRLPARHDREEQTALAGRQRRTSEPRPEGRPRRSSEPRSGATPKMTQSQEKKCVIM